MTSENNKINPSHISYPDRLMDTPLKNKNNPSKIQTKPNDIAKETLKNRSRFKSESDKSIEAKLAEQKISNNTTQAVYDEIFNNKPNESHFFRKEDCLINSYDKTLPNIQLYQGNTSAILQIINNDNLTIEQFNNITKVNSEKLKDQYFTIEGNLDSKTKILRPSSFLPPAMPFQSDGIEIQHIQIHSREAAQVCKAIRRNSDTVALDSEFINDEDSAVILPEDYEGSIEGLTRETLPAGTKIVKTVRMEESDVQELEKLFATYIALSIKLNMLQNMPTEDNKSEIHEESKFELKNTQKTKTQKIKTHENRERDKDDIKQQKAQVEQKILENIANTPNQSKKIKKSKEKIEQQKQDDLKSLLKAKFLKEDNLTYLNKITSQNIHNLNDLTITLNLLNSCLNKDSALSKSEMDSLLKYANNLNGNNIITIILEVHNQLMPTGKEKLLLEKLAKVIRSFGSSN